MDIQKYLKYLNKYVIEMLYAIQVALTVLGLDISSLLIEAIFSLYLLLFVILFSLSGSGVS